MTLPAVYEVLAVQVRTPSSLAHPSRSEPSALTPLSVNWICVPESISSKATKLKESGLSDVNWTMAISGCESHGKK